MSFGTALRSPQHSMATNDAVYTPRWRVTAPLVVAKDQEGRGIYCYHGDTLAWLSEAQAKHLLQKNMVERIAPTEPADLDTDSDTATADSTAVDACIGALRRLRVPAAAGAPACRAALRSNDHRYSNATVAEAVRRRKALSDDDEHFETVVVQ